MKYFVLIFLAFIAAIYIYLVLAVNDDKRWFQKFSQGWNKTSSDTAIFDSLHHKRQVKKPTHTLSFGCITAANENSKKVLHLKGRYEGIILVKATVDTLQLSLKEHKIIYANLVAKANTKDKIELRTDSASGDTAYLSKIMPVVKRHLSYLKFKIDRQPDCIMSTWWTSSVKID